MANRKKSERIKFTVHPVGKTNVILIAIGDTLLYAFFLLEQTFSFEISGCTFKAG